MAQAAGTSGSLELRHSTSVSEVYSSGMPKAVELVRQAFRACRPRPLTTPDQAWRRQPRPPDEPFSSSLDPQLPFVALGLRTLCEGDGGFRGDRCQHLESKLLEPGAILRLPCSQHFSIGGGDANVAAAALQLQGLQGSSDNSN